MIIPLLLLLATTLSAPSHLSAETDHALSENPQTLSTYVRQYYADTPLLAEIAWCESRMRQWDKNGDTFRGVVNSYDIGVMQVNALYHEEKAVELGMDIYTLTGNLAYAQYLYDKEGSRPWASSKPCWGKK